MSVRRSVARSAPPRHGGRGLRRVAVAQTVALVTLAGCTVEAIPARGGDGTVGHASQTTASFRGPETDTLHGDGVPAASRAGAESGLDSEIAPGGAGAPAEPPPGVPPTAIAVRAVDGEEAVSARLSLSALLPPEAFIERVEAPAAESPEDALRHYVRGREALQEGRLFVAVTELERALAADGGSTEILRQLARALGAAGGAPRSFDTYLRLLELDPDDAEALFAVATALLNQRAFPTALPPLLALRHRLETDRAEVLDALGDDAEMVVAFALFMALRQTGHDRAAIEAVVPAVESSLAIAGSRPAPLRSRAEEVIRQRGETWRQVGDAWCRLGDPDRALRAYQRVDGHAVADETGLLARRLHVRVWLGDGQGAIDEMLAHVRRDPRRITRQEAALVGWLARQVPDPRPMAIALRRLAESMPEHPALLWTAAGAAPPDEAAALLRAYLLERPRDLAVIAELLRELAMVRVDLSVALAIELVAMTPVDAEAIVERLLAVPARPNALRAALDRLPAGSAREATRAWVLALLRDPGAAWAAIEAAVAGGEDPLLHATRIAMAGALEEPSLLERSVREARAAGAWSREAAIAEVEARLRCRQWERAEAVAADLALDAVGDADALAVAAKASLMHALALPEGSAIRGSAAREAVRSAEAAIEADAGRKQAWETLIRAHDPRSGLLPDVQRLRATIARLQTVDAESPLLLRLLAAEEIGRGRSEQAIDRLVALWERQPADDELLRLLLQAWARQGRLGEAESWFRERLERSPSSPRLADALMTVLVQTGRHEEAIAYLRGRLDADADDGVAAWLLETVLRTTGSPEAASLALSRTMRRPAGPRRDVELASLHLDLGDAEAATFKLERLLGQVALPNDQIPFALAVAERLDDSPRSDRARLALARRALAEDSDAPSIVHGVAILAAARLEGSSSADAVDGAEISGLIDGFARSASGRAGGAETAAQWALLAQRLVNAGRADVAAQAVRRRLDDALGLDAATAVATATLAVTADIAADDPVGAIETLGKIAAQRAALGWPPETLGPPRSELVDDAQHRTLADALVWASMRWSLLGREHGAEALLREAIRLDPQHAMARNNLGYMLLERAERAQRPPADETVRLIESAHAAGPNDSNIVDSIGWLRYLQNRLVDGPDGPDGSAAEGAVTLLLRALELAGDDPSAEILDHCGDALWRIGRVDEAVALWDAARIMLEREYPADRTIPRLAMMMSQEHGLAIRAPAAVWEYLYGRILTRVRAKLDAIAAGERPPVAPISVGSDPDGSE